MKSIFYIGRQDANAALFDRCMDGLPQVSGACFPTLAEFSGPRADLLVLDVPLPAHPGFFQRLGELTDQAVAVPLPGKPAGEIERFLRLAKKAGVNLRFLATPVWHPGFATVFEILGSGVLGTVAGLKISRTGSWPFFPVPSPSDSCPEGDYWEVFLRRKILPAEELPPPGAGKPSPRSSPSSLQPAGEIFLFALEIAGANGTLVHTQHLDRNGMCRWEVVTGVPEAGQRRRSGAFAPALPLAVELVQAISQPQVTSNREIRVIARETALVRDR